MSQFVKIPSKYQRTAVALIDQQMWCWGCDVRRTEGNLLLIYGAEKRPSPQPGYHSAYTFHLQNNTVLNLWGWGIWIARTGLGSLLISRSQFRVRYTNDVYFKPDAWRERHLPLTSNTKCTEERQKAFDLLFSAMHWAGTYESWLQTQVKLDYREQAIAAWPQRKHYRGGIPVAQMPVRWFELAGCILSENAKNER